MKAKYLILSTITTVFLMFSAAYPQTAKVNQTSTDAAARTWNPARTWVYFVGLLEWNDREKFASLEKSAR